MRKPLLAEVPRERAGTSGTVHIPAPVGGWNTRDPISAMDRMDATVLDNFFPQSGECALRGGCENFATGMTGDVKSISIYSPVGGTKKVLAATNSGIYDITAGGAIGAVSKALTNGYIHAISFTNSAGTCYWWAANGVDKPVLYDGTTWTSLDNASTPAITGVTTTSLVYPWQFKHRIFCIEKNSFNVWYLPVDSLGGAAAALPLGNLFKRGGALISGTSWTLDAGDGTDDLCVMITSEGEVALYKGTDPSDASKWALVGVYFVGKPLGRRCFFRLGGDVGVLTENGCFLLSQLLKSGTVNFSSALSNKIQPTFTETARRVGATSEGWEGCVFPPNDALLINVPDGAGRVQYVMNTVTGQWCSFSGWPALCIESYNGALYYGIAGGIVRKAWDGVLVGDLGAEITGTIKQAWTDFGRKTSLKYIEAFRPLLAFSQKVTVRAGISTDFTYTDFTSQVVFGAGSAGAIWDVSPWDTTSWTPEVQREKRWMYAVHHPGYSLALWLQTSSKDSILSSSGTDYVLGAGGVL